LEQPVALPVTVTVVPAATGEAGAVFTPADRHGEYTVAGIDV